MASQKQSDDGQGPVSDKQQVRAQLERILQSDGFVNSNQRKDLLRYFVEIGLDGKTAKEPIVREDVFPAYPSESRIVGIIANELRKRLRTYYEHNAGDPIVIVVPVVTLGSGYTAAFAYRYSLEAVERFEEALELAKAGTMREYRSAIFCCESAIRLDENCLPAHLALAEWSIHLALRHAVESDPGALPIYSFQGNQVNSSVGHKNHVTEVGLRLSQVERGATNALRIDPTLWRPRLLMAFVLACKFDWAQADEMFKSALVLAKGQADDDPLYGAFLISQGKANEAMAILERRFANARIPPDKYRNYLLEGIFRFATKQKRRPEEVYGQPDWIYKSLRMAAGVDSSLTVRDQLAINPKNRPFHMFNWRRLGEARLRNASEFLRSENLNGDPRKCLHRTIEWSLIRNARPLEMAFAFLALLVVRTLGGCPLSWPLDGREMDPDEYLADVVNGRQTSESDSLREALESRAVDCLAAACEDHDPMMMWLHLWPMFDSLRHRPDFQALIAKMKLPGAISTGACPPHPLGGPFQY